MAITAHISSGYRRKLALISLILLIFGLWASYDVFVKYPPELERFTAYNQLRIDGRLDTWPDQARERGWPEEEPPRRTSGDFYFNYVLMLMIPAGLYFGINALMAGKRWIEADEQGVRTYAGLHAPYPSIIQLNDRRWQHKGIALVIYKDPQGRKKRIVLDDFNYQTQPTREIFTMVKNALDAREGKTSPVKPS